MPTIDFTYNYPYCGYGDTGRYKNHWSETRTTLNGNYTYPMLFNSTVPKVSHLVIDLEVTNTGSGTVLGISWDFKVYRSSGGWTNVKTFTLPSDGIYTLECDVPNYNITQFAFIPSSRQSSSRTWDVWYNVEEMRITETITLNELQTGTFQYGLFTNRSGIKKDLTEVYANIDGTLIQATDILVNIDGDLVPLSPVYSAHLVTESETMVLYRFEPPESGTYKIQNKRLSGDHEIRLYDSSFTQMHDGYFYTRSFDLVQGSVYYITMTHYYYSSDTGESNLQVYKEDV